MGFLFRPSSANSAQGEVKFEDKGTFELKGVEEDPTLYGVTLEE